MSLDASFADKEIFCKGKCDGMGFPMSICKLLMANITTGNHTEYSSSQEGSQCSLVERTWTHSMIAFNKEFSIDFLCITSLERYLCRIRIIWSIGLRTHQTKPITWILQRSANSNAVPLMMVCSICKGQFVCLKKLLPRDTGSHTFTNLKNNETLANTLLPYLPVSVFHSSLLSDY